MKNEKVAKGRIIGLVGPCSLTYSTYHAARHYGRAAKCLMNEDPKSDSKSAKENENHLIECFRYLGWDHAVRLSESTLPAKFPLSYRPF